MSNKLGIDIQKLRMKSIGNLRARLYVLTRIIKEAQAKGDERWRKLVPQQRAINEVLVEKIKEQRRIRGEPEPETVKIGMKAASLKARRVRANN